MQQGTGLLASLNSAQQEAVQIPEGPILVSAGPGSGKTRVLTHRAAYLISECGVPAYSIMAVTFTNKAAKEMKSRLEQLIGPESQHLTIGTFHAICARILRREAKYLEIENNFVIYDTDDQLAVVKQVLKAMDLDTKMYAPRAVLNAISRAKDEVIGPDAYNPPTYWHEVVARVYLRYEEALRANNALDFDDLLVITVRLLRDNDVVRAKYQRRYRHILVDEFQDTNTAQYELVKLLAGGYRNLFVVGDSDQSIYGWRGANVRNIRSFTKDFPEAEVVLLEQNYRSTQDILDAAHHVISRNPGRQEKRLWTESERRRPLTVSEVYDEREEAEYVIREIKRLTKSGQCSPGDCAVMYRTNAQSRVLEDAFVRYHMPYKLVGATRFYARREIKDVLAYLQVIHNPRDDVSLRRIINVPSRRIGSKTLGRVEQWAERWNLSLVEVLRLLADTTEESPKEDRPPVDLPESADLSAFNQSFSATARKYLLRFYYMMESFVAAKAEKELLELLDLVLEESGYVDYVQDGTKEGEERWRNIMELRTVAQEYNGMGAEMGLAVFLEEVALVSDVDNLDERNEATTLLTLHAAKGLEFDTVFIVGMEEGILPHSRSLEEPEEMQEERRLCYVGITRAKERLYLIHVFRRTIYGSESITEPSRFLRDIPDELIKGRPGRPSLSKPSRSGRSLGPTGRDLLARRRGKRDKDRKPASRPKRKARRDLPEPAAPQVRETRSMEAEPEFGAGDRVRHEQFGEGVVVSSRVSRDDEIVTVAFAGTGVKKLAASYAHLSKVDQ